MFWELLRNPMALIFVILGDNMGARYCLTYKKDKS
jgi:hypothetical protein